MSGEATGEGPIKVKVSAPNASEDEFEELAKRLKAAGMRVEQALPFITTITGDVDDPATVDALRAIPGAEVEVGEREYQLPPPDEPVQ